ncbi:hypothetical protein Tco_1412522 [Tanacetum coccineum]
MGRSMLLDIIILDYIALCPIKPRVAHMVVAAQNTNNTTIRFEGKLVHLEQPMTPLPYLVASQAARDAYEALNDAQNEIKSYMGTLERLGYAMPKELSVSLISNSLNKDYDQLVQNYNMHSMGKTIVELHAMLKLHEKGAKDKAKGKNKLAYAPKTKIPLPPKRDNPAKDSTCHHCKEVGQWRRNFPSYHVELKKRKNASKASTSGT